MELDEIFHEFRNSLTVVGGFARRLLKQNGLEESKYKNYAQRIVKNVERLESILNQPKGGNNMFWGRCDTSVDKDRRLTIPAAMRNQIDNSTPLKKLLLREDEEGCIEVHEYLALNNPKIGDPSSVFVVSASYNKKNKKGAARIKIPNELENSTSFHYGRRVTLAGKGDRLEIWPRP